ncbi:MAG: M67 family metallopeptidase [Vicinamibacterales bacterium]
MIAVVQRVLDEVRAHAREESPRECCGMLVGAATRILDSVRAANLEAGTTRFRIDPRDQIRAIRDARSRQLDVIGFYHSHPRSRAYPSETDVAEAGYAGSMHLILGVDEQGAQEACLFTIDGANVTELVYHVERG